MKGVAAVERRRQYRSSFHVGPCLWHVPWFLRHRWLPIMMFNCPAIHNAETDWCWRWWKHKKRSLKWLVINQETIERSYKQLELNSTFFSWSSSTGFAASMKLSRKIEQKVWKLDGVASIVFHPLNMNYDSWIVKSRIVRGVICALNEVKCHYFRKLSYVESIDLR